MAKEGEMGGVVEWVRLPMARTICKREKKTL